MTHSFIQGGQKKYYQKHFLFLDNGENIEIIPPNKLLFGGTCPNKQFTIWRDPLIMLEPMFQDIQARNFGIRERASIIYAR